MRKILVIRFDALGDTILTLPLLSALKENYSEAEVTVIASNKGKAALEFCPSVDKIEIAENNNKKQINSLTGKIKSENYDISINVSEKIEGYKLAYDAKIPLRTGFRPGAIQPVKDLMSRVYLTNPVFYDNNPNVNKHLHEVERQFLLLKALGVSLSPQKYRLDIPREDVVFADNFIKSKCLSLHLSQKWLLDGWDESFLSMLIDVILEKYPDFNLTITYGPAEVELGQNLKDLNKNSRVIFFTDPSFFKWASILKKTHALITMDTSASHVAAGLNLPCVTIFGERYFDITVERWHPWLSPYKAVKRTARPKGDSDDVSLIEENFTRNILESIEALLNERF